MARADAEVDAYVAAAGGGAEEAAALAVGLADRVAREPAVRTVVEGGRGVGLGKGKGKGAGGDGDEGEGEGEGERRAAGVGVVDLLSGPAGGEAGVRVATACCRAALQGKVGGRGAVVLARWLLRSLGGAAADRLLGEAKALAGACRGLAALAAHAYAGGAGEAFGREFCSGSSPLAAGRGVAAARLANALVRGLCGGAGGAAGPPHSLLVLGGVCVADAAFGGAEGLLDPGSRDLVVRFYAASVLGSGGGASPLSVAFETGLLAPVLGGVGDAAFDAVVGPALARGLRRGAEATMPCVGPAVRALVAVDWEARTTTVEGSDEGGDDVGALLVDEVLGALRSAKDSARAAAEDAVAALADAMRSERGLGWLVARITDELGGKGTRGRPQASHMRSALLSATRRVGLSSAAARGLGGPRVDATVAAIAAALAGERDGEARGAGLEALAVWLTRASDPGAPLGDEALAAAGAVLASGCAEDNHADRRAHVACVWRACRSNGNAAHRLRACTPLVAALDKLAERAKARAPLREDATVAVAALALMRVSALSLEPSAPRGALVEAEPWHAAVTSEVAGEAGYALTLGSSRGDLGLAECDLVRALLVDLRQRALLEGCTAALTRLLCNADWEVRAEAAEVAAKAAVSLEGEFVGKLLDAWASLFAHIVHSEKASRLRAKDNEDSVSASTSASRESSAASPPTRKAVRDGLKATAAAIAADAMARAEEANALFALCHHEVSRGALPFRTNAGSPAAGAAGATWQCVTDGVTRLPSIDGPTLSAMLLGPSGLSSVDDSDRAAAAAGYASLAHMDPAVLRESLERGLGDASLVDDVLSVSVEDAKAWWTPPGEMVVDYFEGSGDQPDAVTTVEAWREREFLEGPRFELAAANAEGRRKLAAARFASGGSAGKPGAGPNRGRAAGPMRPSMASAKADGQRAKPVPPKVSAEEKAKLELQGKRLAEEADARARVAPVRARASGVLLAVTQLCSDPGCAAWAKEQQQGRLQSIVWPLVASPLVGDLAFCALVALVRASGLVLEGGGGTLPLPPQWSRALTVAYGLRALLVGEASEAKSMPWAQWPFARSVLLACSRACTARGRLEPAAFGLAFPALQYAVAPGTDGHVPVEDREEAARLLGLHADMASGAIPKREMLHTVFTVLASTGPDSPEAVKMMETLDTLVLGLDLSSVSSNEELHVLLDALVASEVHVRTAGLKALGACAGSLRKNRGATEGAALRCRLMIAQADENEDFAQRARQLGVDVCGVDCDVLTAGMGVEELCDEVLSVLGECAGDGVRTSAAKVLSTAFGKLPGGSDVSGALVARLTDLYTVHRPANAFRVQRDDSVFDPRLLASKMGTGGKLVIKMDLSDEEKAVEEKRLAGNPVPRLGAAVALGLCAPGIAQRGGVRGCADVLAWMVQPPEPESAAPLADSSNEVRTAMSAAGVALVDAACAIDAAAATTSLLPVFEDFLNGRGPGALASRAEEEEALDLVRSSVCIFLGTVCKGLDKGSPKVNEIVQMQLDVLRTPSEAVQEAVAGCLAPLMLAISSQGKEGQVIAEMIGRVRSPEEGYAGRRGAAFGLAGVVKGLGLSCLKQHAIIDKMKEPVDEPKRWTWESREGSLMAMECLCRRLGRLFEPYIVSLLPMLLTCFGDASTEVRTATEACSKIVIGQLSAQGVKLVLPTLIRGVEDEQWRAKQAAVGLLGQMSNLAPKQLSAALPSIVPKLIDSLADSHPRVREAAVQALSEVGKVVRNPEILLLVPILLKALDDPSAHSIQALEALINTEFVHAVDAPSLSLLVPIMHRGLRHRSKDAKRKAAAICGSMCKLVGDPKKEMVPYLPLLLPEIQRGILDPQPEVRSSCSKVIGALFLGLGEDVFPGLIAWMLETVRTGDGALADATDSSRAGSGKGAVERQGAAQALAEVWQGLGIARLEEALESDVLPGCVSGLDSRVVLSAAAAQARAGERVGFFTVLRFLPVTFKNSFEPLLDRVLPCILRGLADEIDSVRENALAAGRIIIHAYADTSTERLLRAIEDKFFDSSWRIRQSTVELLGDLLFKLVGISGRAYTAGGSKDDDGGVSTEEQGRILVERLGLEKRNRLLSMVYILKNDGARTVAQSAAHVWKTLVPNTPRLLMEIIGVLNRLLLDGLTSPALEVRAMHASAIGELVAKMGSRVMNLILPVLREGLSPPGDMDPEEAVRLRQGVCLGLSEVLAVADRENVLQFLTDLIPTVQEALSDPDENVRSAGVQVFASLSKSAGPSRVVEAIVPGLLELLDEEAEECNSRGEDPSEENCPSLSALVGLSEASPAGLTRWLVPHVLAEVEADDGAVSLVNALAIGALAEAAPEDVVSHIADLVPPLVLEMLSAESTDACRKASRSAAQALARSVDDESAKSLVGVLLLGVTGASGVARRGSCEMLAYLCRKNTDADMEAHVGMIILTLLDRAVEEDEVILAAAWDALAAAVSTVPKERSPQLIPNILSTLRVLRDRERSKRHDEGHLLPGFCRPKALAPIMVPFLQGIASGTPDQREDCAAGLAELVDMCSEEALRPSVVGLAGPLIRMGGERLPGALKSALMDALFSIVKKAIQGLALKPFLLPLQTIFLKVITTEPYRAARNMAARALSRLTVSTPRLDPLVADLAGQTEKALNVVGGAASEESTGIAEACLRALLGTMSGLAGAKVSEPTRAKVQALADNLAVHRDEMIALPASYLLGALAALDGARAVDTLIDMRGAPLAKTRALASFFRALPVPSGPLLLERNRAVLVASEVAKLSTDKEFDVKVCGVLAARRFLVHCLLSIQADPGLVAPLDEPVSLVVAALLGCAADGEAEVRRAMMNAFRACALAGGLEHLEPHLSAVLVEVAGLTRDRDVTCRQTADMCVLQLLGSPERNEVDGYDDAVSRIEKYVSHQKLTAKMLTGELRRLLRESVEVPDYDVGEDEAIY